MFEAGFQFKPRAFVIALAAILLVPLLTALPAQGATSCRLAGQAYGASLMAHPHAHPEPMGYANTNWPDDEDVLVKTPVANAQALSVKVRGWEAFDSRSVRSTASIEEIKDHKMLIFATDKYAEITGLPDGVYELVTTADGNGALLESDTTDNAATAVFRLVGDDVEVLLTTGL